MSDFTPGVGMRKPSAARDGLVQKKWGSKKSPCKSKLKRPTRSKEK